jgi:nucleoid-associated protein YgaU
MSKEQLSVPNRYKDEFIVVVRNPNGGYDVSVSFRTPVLNLTGVSRVRKHRVKKNETLDKIALQYYSVPDLWYIIADANPTSLFHPNNITNLQGKYIDIPPINLVRIL